MYYVIASDLDGTLLSPNHHLTSYTKETLQLLTARGIHFIFATGRHHIDVAQIRDNLEIGAYMITANGARVHNTFGDLIFNQNLDEDIAYDLCTLKYNDPEIFTNVYRDNEWFLNRLRLEEEGRFCSAFAYQIYQPNLLPTNGISKVFFVCEDTKKLLLLEETILKRWNDRVNVSFSFPTCLEVMAGNVSKGHALEKVSKLLGYSLRSSVAFGDGMNDKEMLIMAGKGYIMSNAHQRLKDLLPEIEIIGSNADDAVSHTLRQLFLI